jgi:hypothetical protein
MAGAVVVAKIRAACASFGVKVRITHEGDDFPSHAAVRQFHGATDELLDLLAGEAWAESVRPVAFNPKR